MKKSLFTMLIICTTSIVKSQTVVVVDNVDGTSSYQNSVDLSGFNSTNNIWENQEEAERIAAKAKAIAVEIYRSHRIREEEDIIRGNNSEIDFSRSKIADLKNDLNTEFVELSQSIESIKQQREKLKRDLVEYFAESNKMFHEKVMDNYNNSSELGKAKFIAELILDPVKTMAKISSVEVIVYSIYLATYEAKLDKYKKADQSLATEYQVKATRWALLEHYLNGSYVYPPIKELEDHIEYLNWQNAIHLDKINWWRVANIIWDAQTMGSCWFEAMEGILRYDNNLSNSQLISPTPPIIPMASNP